MYRKTAPILVAIMIAALLSSCSSSVPAKPSESLTPIVTTQETTTPYVPATETTTESATVETQSESSTDHSTDNSTVELEVWYCNNFTSIGDPPFSLPEAAGYADDYYKYSYTGISQMYYDSFLSGLTSDGFSHATMRFGDFLFREDCMVFLTYAEVDGFFSVSWYQKSPYAPNEGLSIEEAESLLMPAANDSLSKIPMHPIDITPEGFYERTGGQMFAVPFYSYDRFISGGHDELMFDLNEWYACNVCYVIGDHFYATDRECIAVYDVDQDGSDEVLLLSSGPTSGIFTFDVRCVTGQEVFDAIFHTKPYYQLGFADVNGKLVIDGEDCDSNHRYFDIRIENNDGEKDVSLYDGKMRVEKFRDH